MADGNSGAELVDTFDRGLYESRNQFGIAS